MTFSESTRSKAFILNELKSIQLNTSNDYFSVGLIDDDIYKWEVIIFGPKNTPFESGIFKAQLVFPPNYPEEPPTFKFITAMWHPNIDKNGNVCISILHRSGPDAYGYEALGERWMPVRSVESVIVSILSLLDSPNTESAANPDAGRQIRENKEEYYKKVRRYAEKSLEDL